MIHEESFEGVGLSSNVYVLKSAEGYYIFDASGHPDLLSFLEGAGIEKDKILGIFLTHGHYDHVTGLVSLSNINVKAFLNLKDLNLVRNCIGPREISDISEGASLLDKIGLKALPTPGHTPGSTCFYSEGESLLISGDTVFADGYFGRTDLIGGSDSEMKASLKYLSTLEVKSLLPGHGNYILDGGTRAISMALSNANYLL
ncbi:MAG: MBL fold metallo-hydrolase [Candidatus Methanomethylicaceae archaeon]|nr:MBL fold metallo-hydrolase [Candidatus Verstraetearchaeota archaeon]